MAESFVSESLKVRFKGAREGRTHPQYQMILPVNDSVDSARPPRMTQGLRNKQSVSEGRRRMAIA